MGSIAIYLNNDAERVLEELKENDSNFNFSGFIQDALLNYHGISKLPTEVEGRIKAKELELNSLKQNANINQSNISKVEQELASLKQELGTSQKQFEEKTKEEQEFAEKKKKHREFILDNYRDTFERMFGYSNTEALAMALQFENYREKTGKTIPEFLEEYRKDSLKNNNL